MAWFKREHGELDTSGEKRVKTEGLWVKCDQCRQIIWKKDLDQNFHVCPKCDRHFRIDARTRLSYLLDDGKYETADGNIVSTDPLKFTDLKPYADRLKRSQRDTGLNDAVINARGTLNGKPVLVSAMEYSFIGGSMGAVVGEMITRAIERATSEKVPLIVVSASGGARMMEGVVSLMQLAKISAALARMDDAKVPYISVMTDPTTGGVTASFAMLGDLNIAEPGALIGFAGPRVIEQTIRQKLPEGFQRSEFLLEHGMLDAVVHRRDLKQYIGRALEFMKRPRHWRKRRRIMDSNLSLARWGERNDTTISSFEIPPPGELPQPIEINCYGKGCNRSADCFPCSRTSRMFESQTGSNHTRWTSSNSCASKKGHRSCYTAERRFRKGERRRTMRNELHWVKGPWRGKLALAARPRGGDWLKDELAGWKVAGVDTVVSLLTADEERELQLQDEGRDAKAQGIAFLSLPIRDRQVPDSESSLNSTLQQMDEVLSSGKNVLVHCRQGIGRTGLMAACLLIDKGWEPEAAIDLLSAARGVAVPETQEQRRWIDNYAAARPTHLHAVPKR